MQGELSDRSLPTILCYGADRDFVGLLRYILETAGFGVRVAISKEECQRALEQAPPDIILVDASRESSAQDKLREYHLFRSSDRPTLILINEATWRDHGILTLQQEGLEVLPRATPPERLVAVLRSILGREPAQTQLLFEDIELDPVSFRVLRKKHEIPLGLTEFRLLRHFMREPSRVFTRAQLARAAWLKDVYVGSRTVDVHVAHLRRALNRTAQRKLIRTVRGVGYALT